METEEGTALPSATSRCLIIIPCLNEAGHIGALLEKFSLDAERHDMKIIVADGGSTDGTPRIVEEIMRRNPRVVLMHNEKRIQSAAINLAVATHGDGYDYFIRIDAHGKYPDGYCEALLLEAEEKGADSVVVAMATEGFSTFQKATASAQNSKLGNGGAKHRDGAKGHWTDHGHHALMRIEAFRQVGGYDEAFTHNEDAELDYRLVRAGFRIWMTDKTVMVYYPRSSASSLFRQYLGYGRGRAKNLLKHRIVPKVRQALPLMVLPVVAGTFLGVLHWSAVVPAVLWVTICLGYGIWMAVGERNPYGPLAAVSAMIMHFAWSTGFWLQLLGFRKRTGSSS
ncbi:succinoglycan biosynthesis protein exoa [Paramesorhizobium deserti]|uniref:Succinoglycan biosynthesis protein exoa n=1 Tax=Paramesorhizobium deserti TaxID=1494590 RepID=A0A135HTW5_9HYPH|nr:glycosyltransferase family 2 protein [Paramesorhizobium deserti]KXF76624.1 succinoglycan biosynthesis protein exoa [Paramesorhizobium deserti]